MCTATYGVHIFTRCHNVKLKAFPNSALPVPLRRIFLQLFAQRQCVWLQNVELSQSLLMVDIGLPPDLANPAWLGLAKV